MDNLTTINAILLGVIQGATEFLPVSSSGHLAIIQSLMGISMEGGGLLAFDVFLHLGTLIAVLAVFWRDILEILTSIVKFRDPLHAEGRKLFWFLIVGTIPAGVLGILFKDFFEELISSATSAAAMLIVTGVILYGTKYIKKHTIELAQMKYLHAITMGVAQAIAIIPGISRSGSTIAGGLYMGLNPTLAARFSFLLSIPAIGGAAVLQSKDVLLLPKEQILATVIGTIVATVVGFLCIKWFLAVIRKGRLDWFAYYCFAVGFLYIVFTKIICKI